jgi:hypothetical protein
MGIFHFAGLGRSPGAVTAGLSYLKHTYARKYKEIYGEIIEAVVLFTSTEVASEAIEAFASEHNDYMSINVSQTWPRGKKKAVEIVTEFVKREIGHVDIYCCEVDVNDFSACFEAVAKATLIFHPPGDVGKHIWANITGGTNPLNAALFQVAYLSGFINRLYYTFIANPREQGKYLQPFSRDPGQFEFREIYVLKTTFDDRYQAILEELESIYQEDPSRWITSEELLSRLKSKNIPGFENMDHQTFLLDFIHVMQGRGIQRKGKEDAIRLDPEVGPTILRILRSDYVQALLRATPLSDEQIQQLTEGLRIRKFS